MKLKKQLKKQKEINNIAAGENYYLNEELNHAKTMNKNLADGVDSMEKHYNSHMEIAEKEIARLNIIIDYLEVKGKRWK